MLITNDGKQTLPPDLWVGFPVGKEKAHNSVKEISGEVLFLEIGDRTPAVEVVYPSDDIQTKFMDDEWVFSHKNGTPLFEEIMSILDAISMFLVMLTLAFVPSSSVALVVTRSVTHGISNGVSVSLGIVAGDLIFILLVMLGLSVVAETMGWLFLTIKYIGASYLIWLGYTLLISKSSTAIIIEETTHKGNLVTSFLAGLFLTLGDIKAIFFYVSLFPMFVDPEMLRLTDIMLVMLMTLLTVGGVKMFYAFVANKVVAMSKDYDLENKTKKIAGGFMIGAGSYLIVKA